MTCFFIMEIDHLTLYLLFIAGNCRDSCRNESGASSCVFLGRGSFCPSQVHGRARSATFPHCVSTLVIITAFHSNLLLIDSLMNMRHFTTSCLRFLLTFDVSDLYYSCSETIFPIMTAAAGGN